MPDEIHPGSFVGDTVEEFKKLPTWGKVAVGIGVVVVAYVAYQSYQSGKAGSSQATSLPATTSTTGSQSPFPQIQSGDTSVPLLPSGVSPLYNSQGGLTGYQQSAPSSPPPPSTVGATPNPPSGPTTSGPPPFTGILGPGLNFAQAQKDLGTLPAGDKLISGGENRVWEVNPQGIQTLVTSGTGPPVTNSGYPNGQGPPTPGAHGGGSMSIQSYTVHAGENVKESMAKLGLDWNKVSALNGFPSRLNHGDKLRLY
jgi:hypothetical protein